MEYSEALATLKDMFPKHSTSVIDRTLRENHGALNATVTQLLRSAPDARAPTPRPKKSTPAAKSRPPPTRDLTADHIFPPDFLRLPADVEWVKVKVDSAGSSPLQTDDDIMLPSLRKDPHAEMRSLTGLLGRPSLLPFLSYALHVRLVRLVPVLVGLVEVLNDARDVSAVRFQSLDYRLAGKLGRNRLQAVRPAPGPVGKVPELVLVVRLAQDAGDPKAQQHRVAGSGKSHVRDWLFQNADILI
jgi:hypothetical protein